MAEMKKRYEDKFDKLLSVSLKQYCQSVPADFPQRMLSRLEQLEQAEALKKVVRQERALLAAFILSPAAGVILVLIFPNLLLLPLQLPRIINLLAGEAAKSLAQQWQLWLYCAGALFAAAYALYDTLLADIRYE